MVTEWPFVRAHTWDRRIGSGCLRLALGTDKIVRLLPVPQCLVGHKYTILLSFFFELYTAREAPAVKKKLY